MKRLSLLLMTICFFGSAAAGASASTFCVADAGCVAAGGTAQSTVQGALDAAGFTTANDIVQIGPGTFTAPGPTGFVAGNGGAIEIRGAGRTQTTLVGPTFATNKDVNTLRLTASGSAVHDLKVVLPTNPMCGGSVGIMAPTVAIDRVDIATSSESCNYSGIEFDGSLRDSTAAVPLSASGASAIRVNDGKTGTVEDATLSGYYAVYADSLGAKPTVTTVRRSKLIGGAFTIYLLDQSATTVESSLVTTATAAATGLSVQTPYTNKIATATMHGVTFTGPGDAVVVDSSKAGSIASVALTSTIIRGAGTSLSRSATAGIANLSAAYSDFVPPPASASTGPGTLKQTPGNTNITDPRFVDEAGGDLRLRLDSPLRDAGDPAALSGGESTTDLAGAPRVTDGDGDGNARRDVGAYEYQPPAAPEVVAPVTPATAPVITTMAPPPPPPTDTTSPTLSKLKLSPAVFRTATRRAVGRKGKRPPVGSTVRYTVSEAATVTVEVEARASGRRVGKACRKLAKSNRKQRACTLYKTVRGSIVRADAAGAHKLKLSGLLGGKRLKSGRYRLIVVAIDQGGNRSAAVRASFRVVR